MRENVDPSAPIGLESQIGEETWPHRSFQERLIAALKLEPAVYEEIEHDTSALPQSIAVVALAAIAGSIGFTGLFGPSAILTGMTSAFLTWLIWTAICWVVGVKLFDHAASFEELLRTLGFVAAPQLLYLLLVIPVAGWQALVGLVVFGMTALGFVRALRQTLDTDTGRALLVAGGSIVAHLMLGGLLTLIVRSGS